MKSYQISPTSVKIMQSYNGPVYALVSPCLWKIYTFPGPCIAGPLSVAAYREFINLAFATLTSCSWRAARRIHVIYSVSKCHRGERYIRIHDSLGTRESPTTFEIWQFHVDLTRQTRLANVLHSLQSSSGLAVSFFKEALYGKWWSFV
jgi:hypothetical protein